MLWDVSIQKTYKSKQNQFEMDVRFQSNAQRLVLFGPSGAGKTQLLKMLTGLTTPDQGHIRFNHIDLFNSSQGICKTPQERALAYVFQAYALFPHLTVMQNIAFSLSKSWFNPAQHFSHPDVDNWLDKFELRSLAHQYPHQLSGGQSQRVALARALVMQPQAILLDEPFSALDENLRQSLREELSQVQRQMNIPMILISHNPDDVKSFGDEIIDISQGRVHHTSHETLTISSAH
jgi:molybdate transport system ATP-binding protein